MPTQRNLLRFEWMAKCSTRRRNILLHLNMPH